jgi:hypothetical protein
MWGKLGVVGGAIAVAWSVLWFGKRMRRNRTIDVGSVSEAWLAEERGRSNPE